MSAATFTVAAQYRFDTWTTDNGLPQNGVRAITQTPDGYLWFTTFDGLVRFDGVRFRTFNKSNSRGILNNRFTGIFADPDGTVYATTMEDGVLTIYRNGEFTSLTSDQVPGNYISRIERADNGELRFLIEDGDRKGKSWYRLSGTAFEFIDKESPAAADHTIYTNDGAAWKLTSTGVTETRAGTSKFTQADLAKVNFRLNSFADQDGGLWLGENKVFYIRGGQVTTFAGPEGLPPDSFYHSFWQESDKSIWFSSGGASSSSIGLVQYVDGKLKFWGADQGLVGASIQDVFRDREGNTWLATTRGISRLRKQVINSYSKKDGLDHTEIYPLLRAKNGDIWIGSSKGLSVYRDGKFSPIELRSAPPAKPGDPIWRNGLMSVQALWEDAAGTLWVGLNGGIFTVKDGIAELLLNGGHVHAITADREDTVWAATNKGLVRFRDYKLINQYSTPEGLPNEFMTFAYEDAKGVMWFGGYGGLTKFENGRFTNFTKNDGLVGNYVRTIYEDARCVMWIGTYDEGMSRFKDGKFVNYREENGLYNSGVFAIEEDERGNFWISSNRGIYRVKRQELEDFAAGKIAKINSVGYGKGDGMLSNECNGGRQPASLRDDKGRFWFPTQDGVAILDPRLDEPNPQPPTVVIEDVLVEREPVDARAGLTVEAGKRDVEIHYTGISLTRSDQVKFLYKLEGHDKDWIDAGTRRVANYSYLPPGDYQFLVKAANSDGIWVDRPAVLNVTLRPFFYQTYTFYILSIIGVALLLFGIWRISVYQLRLREQKLARLVEERTAELAEANAHLERLANSDGLTKIGNRRRFESFLSDEWHRALRFKTDISLVLIDIDHFKAFNDSYGHQAGDETLQQVAEALAKAIKRPTDLVARFGGEEFAIVLGGTDAAGALIITSEAVENIRDLAIPHRSSDTDDRLTVSAGIATVRASFDRSEIALINAADKALYGAKRDGRNCIHVFDPVTESSAIADALEHALDRLKG